VQIDPALTGGKEDGPVDQTLVLDCGWRPTALVPWERAITLLWERKVEVVSVHEGRKLHSMNWTIEMPAVIRFLMAIRNRRKAVKFSRESVWLRDQGRCQYCGRQVTRDEFTYDHVQPRILGGTTHWTNIVVSCVPCNSRKGGRTPAQAGMKLLTVPVQPKKLPYGGVPIVEWRDGMPESWRTWLRDTRASATYWRGELDQD
jgi:5-methylcytosine-specific restriction endonuclease McrA